MTLNGIPARQGLYNPVFEHDACGIGFVANIEGKKSHNIISQALTILENLNHRGGFGAESNSGDGAGILIQIPHMFYKEECQKISINLPKEGMYGVGMLFLPQEQETRKKIELRFNDIVKSEGQDILGWRDVPVSDVTLGKTAKSSMPFIRQVFIRRSQECKSNLDFERKLYIIRKVAEKFSLDNNEYFYMPSLSSKTVVYKGMLTASQVMEFYLDLLDKKVVSALALVHSRYSTNTFPSWERAHPNRYIIHNGEINTLRGNVNWMNARESLLKSELFGDDPSKVFPIIDQNGSDSSMFDNCLEYLLLSGHSIEHSIMMMIPEPWSNHESMSDEKKAFYEYHSCLMEPWDGPAAMAFTDGTKIGAVLDRNGLRPSRYYITKDNLVILSSEVGVLDIPEEDIISKERLHPGKIFLINTEEKRIITDDEIKHTIASKYPYREWLNQNLIKLEDLPNTTQCSNTTNNIDLIIRQKAFLYTLEELKVILSPIAKDGIEPIGAMGVDTPLAVLSDKPQLLFNYFKQLFAQVTNPPIDALREEIVTSTETYIGSEGNLINPTPISCRQIKLKTPIITEEELLKLKNINLDGFKSAIFSILFKIGDNSETLIDALENLFKSVSSAIKNGANIIILSDLGIDKNKAAIPSLLAVAGLHHHLIREGTRTKVAIVLESGEPREVHHFALLVGYGVSAVSPYLVYETINQMIVDGMINGTDYDKAVSNYIKIITKGIVKIISKMGISTIQSYQGAQIFEALGIDSSVIDKYFTATPSRIGGIDIEDIEKEAVKRHTAAFNTPNNNISDLETGGFYQWRKDGEYHLYNPETIYKLQQSCRTNNYDQFKEYTKLINHQTQRMCTIRGLLEFNTLETPIPIEEVESVESICKRFKTGAMSYGSISQEAHEALAIAMNRLGGKSNTGEGGENPERFIPDINGDSRCSAIKQVASGRFGVTSHYLTNAKEIQIKMAQGAKPGEGGQLPGRKVYPWVAHARGSTPGVGLISPPPHHDIYSIEDLSELIHDLKNANRGARINVKLVSEVGVGTVAAGVAKGRADVVLISGYDGGTGASPRTSLRHAGLPWELGVAETHQTLLLNGLRSRIVVETDGKLMTGKDVVVAALLGAEEFGFATAPLVVLGCVMMRVCNLDTCPVGIATQNPDLRKRFKGDPSHVVNFMHFIAKEMREIMASLGFRNINEMIGRTDKLRVVCNSSLKLDLSNLLYIPKGIKDEAAYCIKTQDHELYKSLDETKLLKVCEGALKNKEKVKEELQIKNTNRVVGTILGSEVTRRFGVKGLPEDTIHLIFKGSAGQSFGAFVPNGITMELEGDSNDYIGKGICGGKIIVYPPKASTFVPEENIIIGNVAFYGATSGEAFIKGVSGERFCVRNSGVTAVVEGVGDHACEYMTGGTVIVLGSTGRNFAAGMSGGIAYVYDENKNFLPKCNKEMVEIEDLTDEDESCIKLLISKHIKYTDSKKAREIIDNWDLNIKKFVKIIPKDYKRMLKAIKQVNDSGLTGNEALMAAFYANNKDIARIGGN